MPDWSELAEVDLDEELTGTSSLYYFTQILIVKCQGDMEMRSPFSSRLWAVRASIQRGFEALYTVQVQASLVEGD
jgi:hypothetical protein